MPPRILAGYFFEVTIEGFVAARKCGSVVMLGQWSDKPGGCLGHLCAETLLVAARRFAKPDARSGWIQNGADEGFTLAIT